MRELVKKLMPTWLLQQRWRSHFEAEMAGAGEPELRLLEGLVPRAKSAIDVGGNVGTYTYFLSRYATHVNTFEPMPNHVWRLQRLGLANVTVHQVALSNDDGDAELVVPAGDAAQVDGMGTLERDIVANPGQRVTVKKKRLDEFGFTNVGFVKIDVEGHEEAVLKGGLETLKRERPVCLIEIEERHNKGGLERIAAMLATLGYTATFLRNGVREPLSAFDAAVDQNLAGGAPYVNNFIFTPVGQGA